MLLKYIAADILNALRSYGLHSALIALIITLSIILVKKISHRTNFFYWNKNNLRSLLFVYLFFLQCMLILSITIFSRESGSRETVNLKLFATISNNIYGLVYPIENILLFIPFGFLFPVIRRNFRRWKQVLASGLIFSIAIETVQYLTKRGYLQTDDIIMNTLGTLLGYLLFLLVCRLFG